MRRPPVKTPLEHLTPEQQAALDPEVYASLGRLLTGAPPPAGTVTITATDDADWHAQWAAIREDAGAADRPPAPSAGTDPGDAPGRQ
jgi:hypothetical protein